MATTVRKVYAYVTRVRAGVTELLVFEHRGMPDAGVQVPGGGVEPGEDWATGAVRELEEESGLRGLECRGLLDAYVWVHSTTGKRHQRQIFHFLAPAGVPDTWAQVPRGENEEHRQFVFEFRWIPIDTASKSVSGDQGRSAALLK